MRNLGLTKSIQDNNLLKNEDVNSYTCFKNPDRFILSWFIQKSIKNSTNQYDRLHYYEKLSEKTLAPVR